MDHEGTTDDRLVELCGTELASPVFAGVRYRLAQTLGEGGSCLAFLAERIAPDGSGPAVIKIVRPSLVCQDPNAPLHVRKEAVALGRLNERMPPTPFVVRLIDTGSLPLEQADRTLELPWLAVEYVHGGAEGATLEDRVDWSIDTTGFAFEPERSALAAECLTRALTAVHEVGVIHRDVKPDNVLCCGFGDDEIFKLADFGIARPTGMAATFGGDLFGTPGYAAPEILGSRAAGVGIEADVFGMAAVIFYLLTGEHYFAIESPHAHLLSVSKQERRSLLDTYCLSPELRVREEDCRTIDAVLARATWVDPNARPPTASALGAPIVRCLRGGAPGTGPVSRRRSDALQHARSDRIERMSERKPNVDGSCWSWAIRRQPGWGRRLVRGAWGGDGRCLALAGDGLVFWDGTSWRDAMHEKLPELNRIRFLHRAGPGLWIVGSEGGAFAFSSAGVVNVLGDVAPSTSYLSFSGDLDDLGVFVVLSSGGSALQARVGGWSLRPMALPGSMVVRDLVRVDAATWLVVGDDEHDAPFAALYAPLAWRLDRIEPGEGAELRACGGHVDRKIGLAVGADGAALWWDEGVSRVERLPGAQMLTSAAVDAVGRGWAAERGRIWLREPGQKHGADAPADAHWQLAWQADEWTAPMIALFADVGLVLGVAADGSIVEGRRVEEAAPAEE